MEFITNLIHNMTVVDYIVIAGGILTVLFAVFVQARLRQRDAAANDEKRRIAEKRYLNLYKIFTTHKLFARIFKGYVMRLSKRLSVLSVYTKKEIQVGTAKYAYRLFVGIFVCAACACLVFRDITSAALCVAFFYVYTQISIERSVEATTLRVYRELKSAVASIRIEYKKGNKDVLLAVENAAYRNRIAPVMERLHTVLTSATPEEALTEFYEMVPFKQIQTLAMICYNIKNNGDSLDKYNNSTFDEAMLLMNSDINQKIEQMDYEQMKFKRLENLALVGIALTVGLRYLMYYIMPSVALVYNSFVGFLIQNGVIFLSIYYYRMIAHAHLQSVIVNDDRLDIVRHLMGKRFIQKLVRAFAPKGPKRRFLARRLDLCFSQKTVDDFWCEKCLYALVAFAAVAVIVFTSPRIERQFLQNYTKSFDLLGDNSAYEDSDGNETISKEEILQMDDTYIAVRKTGKWWDQNDTETVSEIQAFIRGYLPNISSVQMQDMMTRLKTKYERLLNVKFHWYLLLIAYLAAGIAFVFPDKALKKREEIAREDEEEEFLQLQIVTMILASMNLDTMETVSHLALISDIHKTVLTRCDYGYASNPVEELSLAQEKTQSENFKQFLGKLKETVEELSLQEAFADLANDREHICAERNAYIKENIDRRRAKMGLFAMRPMNFAIYGMMVFPLLYTGITGMMSAISQITAL